MAIEWIVEHATGIISLMANLLPNIYRRISKAINGWSEDIYGVERNIMAMTSNASIDN